MDIIKIFKEVNLDINQILEKDIKEINEILNKKVKESLGNDIKRLKEEIKYLKETLTKTDIKFPIDIGLNEINKDLKDFLKILEDTFVEVITKNIKNKIKVEDFKKEINKIEKVLGSKIPEEKLKDYKEFFKYFTLESLENIVNRWYEEIFKTFGEKIDEEKLSEFLAKKIEEHNRVSEEAFAPQQIPTEVKNKINKIFTTFKKFNEFKIFKDFYKTLETKDLEKIKENLKGLQDIGVLKIDDKYLDLFVKSFHEEFEIIKKIEENNRKAQEKFKRAQEEKEKRKQELEELKEKSIGKHITFAEEVKDFDITIEEIIEKESYKTELLKDFKKGISGLPQEIQDKIIDFLDKFISDYSYQFQKEKEKIINLLLGDLPEYQKTLDFVSKYKEEINKGLFKDIKKINEEIKKEFTALPKKAQQEIIKTTKAEDLEKNLKEEINEIKETQIETLKRVFDFIKKLQTKTTEGLFTEEGKIDEELKQEYEKLSKTEKNLVSQTLKSLSPYSFEKDFSYKLRPSLPEKSFESLKTSIKEAVDIEDLLNIFNLYLIPELKTVFILVNSFLEKGIKTEVFPKEKIEDIKNKIKNIFKNKKAFEEFLNSFNLLEEIFKFQDFIRLKDLFNEFYKKYNEIFKERIKEQIKGFADISKSFDTVLQTLKLDKNDIEYLSNVISGSEVLEKTVGETETPETQFTRKEEIQEAVENYIEFFKKIASVQENLIKDLQLTANLQKISDILKNQPDISNEKLIDQIIKEIDINEFINQLQELFTQLDFKQLISLGLEGIKPITKKEFNRLKTKIINREKVINSFDKLVENLNLNYHNLILEPLKNIIPITFKTSKFLRFKNLSEEEIDRRIFKQDLSKIFKQTPIKFLNDLNKFISGLSFFEEIPSEEIKNIINVYTQEIKKKVLDKKYKPNVSEISKVVEENLLKLYGDYEKVLSESFAKISIDPSIFVEPKIEKLPFEKAIKELSKRFDEIYRDIENILVLNSRFLKDEEKKELENIRKTLTTRYKLIKEFASNVLFKTTNDIELKNYLDKYLSYITKLRDIFFAPEEKIKELRERLDKYYSENEEKYHILTKGIEKKEDKEVIFEDIPFEKRLEPFEDFLKEIPKSKLVSFYKSLQISTGKTVVSITETELENAIKKIQDFFKDFSNLKPFKRESLKSKLQEIDFPKKIRRIKEGIDKYQKDITEVLNELISPISDTPKSISLALKTFLPTLIRNFETGISVKNLYPVIIKKTKEKIKELNIDLTKTLSRSGKDVKPFEEFQLSENISNFNDAFVRTLINLTYTLAANFNETLEDFIKNIEEESEKTETETKKTKTKTK
ncbi:MAG: hypothetical protein ACPL1F_00020, partial [bacterium]